MTPAADASAPIISAARALGGEERGDRGSARGGDRWSRPPPPTAVVRVFPRHDLGTSLEPPRDSIDARGPRRDGWWAAHILTPGSRTALDVVVCIEGEGVGRSERIDEGRERRDGGVDSDSDARRSRVLLEAAFLTVELDVYGSRGFFRGGCRADVALPLAFPQQPAMTAGDGGDGGGVDPAAGGAADPAGVRRRGATTAVRTHLLTHLDDPVVACLRYARAAGALPGRDAVVMAESALACVEGRWRPAAALDVESTGVGGFGMFGGHPSTSRGLVVPGLAVRLFGSQSSVATRGGMGALADALPGGRWAVVAACLFGIVARALGLATRLATAAVATAIDVALLAPRVAVALALALGRGLGHARHAAPVGGGGEGGSGPPSPAGGRSPRSPLSLLPGGAFPYLARGVLSQPLPAWSRGGFYRWLGDAARLHDDASGTAPPMDGAVVLAPALAAQTCDAIRRRSGLAACVADANDLGRVDLVGASDGVDVAVVVEALRPNPQGNGDQGTPLVVVWGGDTGAADNAFG